MSIGRLSVVAIDCPDQAALARFYSAITGWAIDGVEHDWVQLRSDSGATLAFQHVAEHRPPQWPDGERPQQLHRAFDVDDLVAAEQQVLALGARRAEVQPGEGFTVFLDPAGHPFCLVRADA